MEESFFYFVLLSDCGPDSAMTYDSLAPHLSWNHPRRPTKIQRFQSFTPSERNRFAKI